MFKIYKVTNSINDRVYIGATTQKVNSRIQNHYYKSETSTGSKFHEGIATHGLNSFQWETIDTAFTINELAMKEKQYINSYDSVNNGYNSDCGGALKKTVYQYTADGVNINRFSSLSEAASKVNVCKQAIGRACLNSSSTCKGYYWSYELLGSPILVRDKRCKNVFRYSLNKELQEVYKSVADAARKTGYSESGISRVCRGERSSYKNYLWKY